MNCILIGKGSALARTFFFFFFFFFFAAFCVLLSLFAFFCVPETRGKTLEDISLMFGDNSAEEELALKREMEADIRGNQELSTP